MAYFITASASASVVQTTFDTTGSIVTSSLFTPNDPLNVDNITTIKKSRSQYPNLNRPIYKESVSFTNNNGTAINWLYDNTASRDSDFNIIKALNTNYEKSGGGSWVGTATSDLNMATYDIYGIANVTASGNISASGNITATSFIGDGSSLTNLQRPTSLSVSANMTASNDNAGYFFEVGAVTCSIQSSSLVACDIGSEFEFFQSSSGNFIFVTGSGVTLMSKGGALTLTGQYSAATLKKIRDDEWILVGDLT
jgi:hypothetical protein